MKKKESKSLKVFKKGFKKNEIVIYAIALMLVTAGYFNYTANVDDKYLETSSQEVKNTNPQEEVSKEEAENSSVEETQNTNTEEVAASTEKSEEQENRDDDIGDAKLVNSDDVEKEDKTNATEEKAVNSDTTTDYFAASKLERDTNYADMISTYTSIIEDSSVSETQKTTAMNEITKINNNKNSINICENLLSTKGFKNSLVLVNNDSINVVVSKEEEITKQKVAQIQNIVSREFKCEIENIHITERDEK